MTNERLKIAMVGQKGIPARYGGVETHVEQISTRLAARGHDVWVYCRSRFRPSDGEISSDREFDTDGGLRYKGVRLEFRPSVNTKHLDAATHTALCALDTVVRGDFDIVHFHGIGPSAFAPIARMSGRTIVATLHALDWRQVKWGWLAKQSLLQGEAKAARGTDGMIVVSRILHDYVRERYGVETCYIPNGAAVETRREPDRIHRFGLQGGDYVLTVGRIIPDRALHVLIEAFAGLDDPTKLVIVGSESPRTTYSDRLEAMAGEQVIFTGDQYGETLAELYSNCRFYVLASEVEGLPITVCEAMGYGRPVLLSNIPENVEVGGDVAVYFKTNDISSLQSQLQAMLNGGVAVDDRGRRGLDRVAGEYNWDRLAAEVEAFYEATLARRRGQR